MEGRKIEKNQKGSDDRGKVVLKRQRKVRELP